MFKVLNRSLNAVARVFGERLRLRTRSTAYDAERRSHLRARMQGASSSTELRVIYRISDGSNAAKNKMSFATKENCLRNFLAAFGPRTGDLTILADNVHDSTWETITALHSNATRVEIGSGARSWNYAIREIAFKNYGDEDVVYMVEDDYIHRVGAAGILLEGMELADYVTLYDHPDKYINGSDGGPNPHIAFGGELTRVARSSSVHWKVTNSTTMTFAAKVRTLRDDWGVWDSHTQIGPDDFGAFMALGVKGRTLISSLPAYATHAETAWAAPGVDWEEVMRQTNKAYGNCV